MRSTFPSTDAMYATFDGILGANLSGEIRDSAVAWYHDANGVAHRLCDIRPDWTLEVACCVISAFSPRERWESNVAKSIVYATGIRPAGLGANYRRAQDAERNGVEALRGRKTNAFARAIYGEADAIVIDTWMLKAALCGRETVTVKQYDAVADAVRRISPVYGMTPRETQAAIWIIVRGSAK